MVYVHGVVLGSGTVSIVGNRVNCRKFVSNEESSTPSLLLSSVSGDAVLKSISRGCSGVNGKSSYNSGRLFLCCEVIDVLMVV